jgi:hypothetical protein
MGALEDTDYTNNGSEQLAPHTACVRSDKLNTATVQSLHVIDCSSAMYVQQVTAVLLMCALVETVELCSSLQGLRFFGSNRLHDQSPIPMDDRTVRGYSNRTTGHNDTVLMLLRHCS